MANVVCKIDGVVVPTPKYKMPFQYIDLQTEGYTDALGFTHKETVRYGKKRYNTEWSKLTQTEFDNIYNLTSKEWFAFELTADGNSFFYLPKAYRGNVDGVISTMSHGLPEYENVKIAMIQE